MKKIMKSISLLLVLALLTTTLCACSSEKKFVGTWASESSDEILVFASDGTGSITSDGISGSLHWSVNKNKVFISVSICGMSETAECTYKFSGKKMILTDTSGSVEVYYKQ